MLRGKILNHACWVSISNFTGTLKCYDPYNEGVSATGRGRQNDASLHSKFLSYLGFSFDLIRHVHYYIVAYTKMKCGTPQSFRLSIQDKLPFLVFNYLIQMDVAFQ